jgi:hypothetical protein
MPASTDLSSPTIRPFSLDEDLGNMTLRAIDIFADGDLHITDVEGNEKTVTFTGVAPCFRWVIQISKVHTTGTTIGIDDLVGLH